MRIRGLIWLRSVVDKLATKHRVQTAEVEEAFENRPRIHLVEKGQRQDEDVYMALGQTAAGRYLAILFVHKRSQEALILSARDMAPRERRGYGRK